MKTHVELKSKTYLEPMVHFAQNLLGIRFSRSGRDRFTAFCPFHADTKDSFRVYVNDRGEVRFHCFGACNGEWDIYDIIMLSRKCGFRQAVKEWAEHLGINEYAVDADRPVAPDLENIPEPDDSPGFAQPEELDPEIADALSEASAFYNDLLLCRRADFEHIWKYLARRGVHEDAIRKFNIGYSPPYQDERFHGRALTLQRHLMIFDDLFESLVAKRHDLGIDRIRDPVRKQDHPIVLPELMT